VPGLNIDADVLRRLLVDEGRSFSEVARLFDTSHVTVARRARALGIEATHTRVKRPELHEGDWLRDQFAAGRGIDDVAAELGVTSGTVVHARQRLGISTARAPKRPIDLAEVHRRLEIGESKRSIGRALGHSGSAISRAVKRGVARAYE
jgi:DNA invertase Pin-like site-specific DNA recombinase